MATLKPKQNISISVCPQPSALQKLQEHICTNKDRILSENLNILPPANKREKKSLVGGFLVQELVRLHEAKRNYKLFIEKRMASGDNYIKELETFIEANTIKINQKTDSDQEFLEKFYHKEHVSMQREKDFFGSLFSDMESSIKTVISHELSDLLLKIEQFNRNLSSEEKKNVLQVAGEIQNWGHGKSLDMEQPMISGGDNVYTDTYYELLYGKISRFMKRNKIIRKEYSNFCEDHLYANRDSKRSVCIGVINYYDAQSQRQELAIRKKLLQNWIQHTRDLKKVPILSSRVIDPFEKKSIKDMAYVIEHPLLKRMFDIICAHFNDQPEKHEYANSMLQNFKHKFNQDAIFHTLFFNQNSEENFDEKYENLIAFLRIIPYENPLNRKEKIIGSFFIEPDFRSSGIIFMLKEVLVKEFASGTQVIHMDVEPNSSMEKLWRTYGFTFVDKKKMCINRRDEQYCIFHHYSLTESQFFNSRALIAHIK